MDCNGIVRGLNANFSSITITPLTLYQSFGLQEIQSAGRGRSGYGQLVCKLALKQARLCQNDPQHECLRW